MHPNPRKAAPIVLLLVLAAAAWFYFGNRQAKADAGRLSASGTVEATQVGIAPELGGSVAEVLVREGDSVGAGEVLVRFEDSLLQAQLEQAEAALALAQANYDLVAAGQAREQRQAAITAAELELTAARQALQDLYDTAGLAQARARQAVAAAEKSLDQATQRLDSLNSSAKQVDIDSARATVVLAKDQLDKARKDFEPYKKKPEDNLVRARLQARLAEAQKQYDALVSRLNNLEGKSNRYDLGLAEADKTLAEASLAEAQRELEKVKDGPDPEALALASRRLEAAQARLEAAQAEPSAEQLDLAQAQVENARAALGVIQAQMEKLVLSAPLDGIVLSRSVEPGQVCLPGAPLLTLARLDDLTITIYIPEDRYGTVNLGQEAQVRVDSFPGTVFTASVVYIAGQAEFTPRNVQTAEGRRATVFAVKLSIANPEGKLKPGMPADVTF